MTQKQLNNSDELTTFLLRVYQFTIKNKIQIVSCLALILIVFSLFLGYRYYLNSSENRASALLKQSKTKYETSVTGKGPVDAYHYVEKDFQAILDKYSGRNAGRIATVVFADICYKAGDYDRAIALNEKAMQYFDNCSFKNLILSSLGYCYEEQKDYIKAAKYFEMIASGPDSTMKDQAYFNLGRLYTLTGNSEGSINAYKKIVSDYPDSIYIEIAKENLNGA